MKNLLPAVIVSVALASVTLAQVPLKGPDKAGIAVVEFTPGPKASGMTAEAKRQLQASIAFKLVKTNQCDVVDVRHTRDASQASLASVNGASTDAAVQVGKQLGVRYVLTGTVDEYNPEGLATVAIRLVEVATGKVKHTDQISQHSTSEMRTGGDAEMKTKVLLPLIEKLTARLAEEAL